MGVSSTRGIRVPEDRRLVVYVLMCTLGREDGAGSWGGLRAAVVVEVREEGVGAQETLMTCWRPWRQMESTTSPLKKSSSIDFSWMYCGWVSKSSDAKCISGLWPGVDLGVLNSFMLVQLSTPTSIMSSTRPSYILTNVRPFGLFLVVCPTTKSDASFLDAQNSREDIEVVAASNGWITFFFENEMAFGRFRAISSRITALRVSPVCVPFTNIAVRGSSTSFGARATKARFERAFLGFIVLNIVDVVGNENTELCTCLG